MNAKPRSEALTALPEGLSSVPNTHVRWFTTACKCCSNDSDTLFLLPKIPICGIHAHRYIHIKNRSFFQINWLKQWQYIILTALGSWELFRQDIFKNKRQGLPSRGHRVKPQRISWASASGPLFLAHQHKWDRHTAGEPSCRGSVLQGRDKCNTVVD